MEIQAPISAKLTIKIIVVFQADFLIKKNCVFPNINCNFNFCPGTFDGLSLISFRKSADPC